MKDRVTSATLRRDYRPPKLMGLTRLALIRGATKQITDEETRISTVQMRESVHMKTIIRAFRKFVFYERVT